MGHAYHENYQKSVWKSWIIVTNLGTHTVRSTRTIQWLQNIDLILARLVCGSMSRLHTGCMRGLLSWQYSWQFIKCNFYKSQLLTGYYMIRSRYIKNKLYCRLLSRIFNCRRSSTQHLIFSEKMKPSMFPDGFRCENLHRVRNFRTEMLIWF